MGIKVVLRMFTFLLLLVATGASAAEIRGRSSTQFLWFNNQFSGSRESELVQYLSMSATKVDPSGKLSLYGYGRVSQNFEGGDGLNARLYYLYGDYSDFMDMVDVRAGRQFVNLAAGAALIDGAQVTVKNVGPVAFTVVGGRDVIFGLDDELTRSGDYMLGVSGTLVGYKLTDLELSWFGKWSEGDMSREILGASFKQYLLSNLKMYGNARYDITSEVFSEVLGGMKYFPTANLMLTGEWYQSYPVFDTTSIYSVFSVDRYQEGVLRADYTINEKVSVNAGYSHQEYGEGADAEVYGAGVTVKPIEDVTLALTYDRRHGYGGELNGGTADLFYQATKELELATGVAYDVYQRDNMTGEETARKYWGGARYRLAKNMSASVRVEDNVNVNYGSDWQGRCVFNYDF